MKDPCYSTTFLISLKGLGIVRRIKYNVKSVLYCILNVNVGLLVLSCVRNSMSVFEGIVWLCTILHFL